MGGPRLSTHCTWENSYSSVHEPMGGPSVSELPYKNYMCIFLREEIPGISHILELLQSGNRLRALEQMAPAKTVAQSWCLEAFPCLSLGGACKMPTFRMGPSQPLCPFFSHNRASPRLILARGWE